MCLPPLVARVANQTTYLADCHRGLRTWVSAARGFGFLDLSDYKYRAFGLHVHESEG